MRLNIVYLTKSVSGFQQQVNINAMGGEEDIITIKQYLHVPANYKGNTPVKIDYRVFNQIIRFSPFEFER